MMRHYQLIFIATILSGAPLLSSCERDNLLSICENYPELCQNLNTDSWCRYERTDVIRDRYYQLKDPGPSKQYELMKSYETYRNCLELAIHVEPKKSKDKRTARIDALLFTDKQLADLNQKTAHSKNPHLLLWHWTRNKDPAAKTTFISQEGTPSLETSELQMALAGYYANRDPRKSVRITYHALELLKRGEPIPGRELQALITLNLKIKNYHDALLWAYVAQQLNLEDNPISPERLFRFQTFSEEDLEQLQEEAETIAESIYDREFKVPKTVSPLPTHAKAGQ